MTADPIILKRLERIDRHLAHLDADLHELRDRLASAEETVSPAYLARLRTEARADERQGRIVPLRKLAEELGLETARGKAPSKSN